MPYTNSVESGKTFRKISQHIPQDPLLKINFKNLNRESVEFFNNTYSKDVCYSMKKKNRWMLSSLLSHEHYDNDDVIMYTKHQCLLDQTAENTTYLFDSLSSKQLGSTEVSDQRLNKKTINGGSAIRTIEEKGNYTQQEYVNFEKLKRRGKEKRKKSRKNHRQISTYIPEEDETLPCKEEYLMDVESRKDCIYIREYIHVNNLSMVNIGTPIHRKRSEMSSNDMNRDKVRKRKLTKNLLNNDYELDDNYEDNDDRVEEVTVDDWDDSNKPFMIAGTDLLCRKTKNQKKKYKRTKKYSHLSKPHVKTVELPAIVETNSPKESDFIVDLSRDNLPFIVINMDLDSLISELDIITDLCQCWSSATVPESILIDLENVVDVDGKHFLILKPKIGKDSKSVTLKVLFNMSQLDFNEILDRRFGNLREIMDCLQLSMKSRADERSWTSQELFELDKPMEGLDVVWKIKKVENPIKIYEYHDEWKRYKIDKNDVASVVLGFRQEVPTYALEFCEICFGEFSEEEMITMKVCKHKICEECMSSHLICRLATGMEHLSCPGTECTSNIDCVTILSFLSWKQYQKRLKRLETLVTKRIGTSCFYCRTVTTMNDDGMNTIRKQLDYRCCCGRIVCNICGKRQHWPSSCYEIRKHDDKLKSLKDIEILSESRSPLIVEGINCPKCFYFVVKTAGCNHMTCVCGTHFCWLCGDNNDEGKHKTSGFPCYSDSQNKLMTFDLTYVMPSPSELRPKLYILSINERIKCLSKNKNKLFKGLNEIFTSKLGFHVPVFDVRDLESQFFHLINVTENVFIKAYHVEKRKQFTLRNYLKNSAITLLFYQNQINLYMETICHHVAHSRKDSSSIKDLKDNCTKLIKLFSHIRNHIHNMHFVLQS